MAHMQLQLEKQARRRSPIADIVSIASTSLSRRNWNGRPICRALPGRTAVNRKSKHIRPTVKQNIDKIIINKNKTRQKCITIFFIHFIANIVRVYI